MSAAGPEIKTFADLEAMSRDAAARALAAARAAVEARGRFSLALSGGKTPRRLYELLAASELPWELTHVFWGDERCVPQDDPASNYRLARETLLSRAAIPPANVHAMSCDAENISAGAAAYDAALRKFFRGADATFDLVLLGLGPDGHTASLFPGETTLGERVRWVLPTLGVHASPPVPRLTLTLPALNSSRQALLLAAGPGKKALVDAAAGGQAAFPAALVRPKGGVCWLWSQAE
jgi:6-phosphogluconolactonase